jgi:hypothetical protein
MPWPTCGADAQSVLRGGDLYGEKGENDASSPAEPGEIRGPGRFDVSHDSKESCPYHYVSRPELVLFSLESNKSMPVETRTVQFAILMVFAFKEDGGGVG